MPTGSIEHQDNMHIGRDRFANEPQMMIHVRRVNGRSQQGRRDAGGRVNGAEQIDPFVLGLFDRCRTGPLLGPTPRQGALLADPCLVLEPDFDALVAVFLPDPLDKKGVSSNHACICSGSFLR